MTETEDLVVTIEVDATRAVAAFAEAARQAAEAMRRFAPYAWRIRLAGQRDRSRLVTRRKQRRHW